MSLIDTQQSEQESVECPTLQVNDDKYVGNDTSNEVNSTPNSSQTLITAACIVCKKTTSKKDSVFECKTCKELVHYTCSRLPAYTIYSLKTTKRKFVCEVCAAPSNEFMDMYDNKDNEIATEQVMNDIFSEIKILFKF